MKTLFLVRHAQASWEAPSDFERPLHPHGHREAEIMAARLKEKECKVNHILCSSALRTTETSEYLIKGLNFSFSKIQFEKDLYLPTPKKIKSFIESTSKEVDSLMLIAHNPGVSQVIQELAGEYIGAVLPCTIVRFEIDIDDWSHLDPALVNSFSLDAP